MTQTSIELLSQVLDTNATGIIILDHESNIIFWNQWLEKTSKIKKEDATNKNLFSLFPELKGSRIDNAIKLSISKGNASFISYAFNKKPFPLYSDFNKKKPIHQVTYIKPIHLNDNEHYCYIQIKDSSPAVYRERQLRKMADEANELSKLKSGFVSSVSHELRTPLTSIMGALGLLKAGVEDPSSEAYKTMLSIAFNNAERLLILINDILDIEKIESGKMDYIFSKEKINDIIDNCITQNEGLTETYNVIFNFKKNSALPELSLDKDRIFQVLNNLFSNAAKFEPNGGTIEINAELENDHIRVSVTDHGKGIGEDFKSRIFEAFTQEDVSNIKGIAGTGLGLAISKKIIEHHKGKINFECSEKGTTCFYFTLPIHKEV